MLYNKKNYIIRDSQDNFYKLYINKNKLTLESKVNLQTIFKEDILEYAAYIDKKDKIHITYFTNEGELNYAIYYEKELEGKNIFSLSREYELKLLNIKIISSKIHIFYELNNLNKKHTYIYHTYFRGNKWINKKVAEPDCVQYKPSYYVDYCDKSIYILYSKNYNLGEYNLKRFDIDGNKWENYKNTIFIKGANNLDFFVTPNNTAIICFNRFVNNNLQTNILYKDFNVSNYFWFWNKNISKNYSNTFKPMVLYKNKDIYIMWKQGNSIIYKKSRDMLYWSKETVIDIKLNNIYDFLYLSNNSQDYNLKINHIQVPSIEFLYSIVNHKNNYPKGKLNKNNIRNNFHNIKSPILKYNSINALPVNNNKITKEKNDYIQTLTSEIEAKDRKIIYFNELNLDLKNQVTTLKELINIYEEELQNFKAKQILYEQNIMEIIYKYGDKIKKIEKEKNNLFIDINKKIEGLLKIIEEKNHIIEKLYEIIERKS